MSFKRHLEPKFIEELNKLRADPDSWWSRLIGDPDVFTDEQEGASVGSGRVDLVAVNGEGRLTLVEAKLYTNADLRARDTPPERRPKVCTQLLEYHEWAMREGPAIIKAYSKVCQYRRELGLVNAPHLPAAASDLNRVPRLLIFGFDRAQQKQFDSTAIERGITIPGFAREYIRTLGSPRSVNNTHLE